MEIWGYASLAPECFMEKRNTWLATILVIFVTVAAAAGAAWWRSLYAFH
jgi:hypothetical protein